MQKLTIVASLIISIVVLIRNCDSAPIQFLPMREGYVPVYIRHGDTPLNEINPELAVAFHEVGVNARQDKSGDGFAVPAKSASIESNANSPTKSAKNNDAADKTLTDELIKETDQRESVEIDEKKATNDSSPLEVVKKST